MYGYGYGYGMVFGIWYGINALSLWVQTTVDHKITVRRGAPVCISLTEISGNGEVLFWYGKCFFFLFLLLGSE